METYSRTQAMEGASGSDPVSKWTVRTGETGLEESFWHLGLGGEPESYPERPDEADCMYYLRTGYCGYGNRCRFNHPRDRTMVMGTMKANGGDYPERPDQPVCQYYMKTGMCKFGTSCKYHHPSEGGGSQMPAAVNVYGYPLRPGEKECSYYVKTGQCKFGVTCKFHHPQPAGVPLAAPMPGPGPGPVPMSAPVAGIYPTIQPPPVQSNQQYGVVSGNWPVTRPTLLPGSYIPGTYGPMILPPGMVSVPGWSSYPPPVSSVASATTQPNVGASTVYGLTQLSSSAPAYTGHYLPVSSFPVPSGSSPKESALPERPGEPECQFYMKTGDCKFGTSCRYHHPSERSMKTNYVLSPMGLPLRPDATICSHYVQNGVCKFGTSCKYDHPMTTLSYCPSASSLTGMPVAPYPVGSYTGTLAPSYSSSDFRSEVLVSGSSQMSSVSSSGVHIGSLFSKGGSVQHSSALKYGSGSGSGFGAQAEE